jgi:hypothetical protein
MIRPKVRLDSRGREARDIHEVLQKISKGPPINGRGYRDGWGLQWSNRDLEPRMRKRQISQLEKVDCRMNFGQD